MKATFNARGQFLLQLDPDQVQVIWDALQQFADDSEESEDQDALTEGQSAREMVEVIAEKYLDWAGVNRG